MKNAADRRQSRQLAALLLLVLAGGLFLEVDHSLEQHGRALYLDLDSLVTFGALALLVVTFMLNRAGHLRIASRMTVVLIVLALFAGAVPTPTAEDVELLYYLAIPIVFSGVLLSVRFTAALGAVVVGGVGLFPVLVPGVPADTVPLTLTIIVAVLTVGAAAARARIDGLRRQELAESEARFRTQVEHAPQAILLLNLERRVWIEANQVAITLFRAPREQMLEGSVHAVPPFASASPDTKLMLDEAVREATTSGHSAFEASVYVPNGSNLTLEVRMVLLPGHAPALVLASFIDITEQRAAEARLRYLATHDTVTGLPNRALFDESLSAALERAERSNRGVAVCFLDLDNFKSINDAFSHSAGDEVLATIGARMRGAIRRSDMVARRGGDEFSLMIEQVRGVTDAELVMQKVEAALAPPVVVSGHEIYVTASIGVSLFPADAVTPELLLRSADTALFHAKARGKNTHAMYSEEMSLAAADQLWLSSELRHAIAQNGISVSYQPQVDPITGITRGVEALARWIHPARGRISPAEFIPVAEETGIITLLTEHVLDTGLAQLARWREAGIPVPRLGVNISTRDVMRADLAETITAALDRYGIPPESLELELTENIAFTSIESSRDRLLQLKRIGVRLAVDDFGTGYSTLHQLAHFPIDTLKLDQRLTPQIVSSANDRAVLAGVMEIASRIGFETVAEGVESEEQLHVFTEMGCTLIQGWYYSPALPAAEITSRLQAGPPVPDRPQPGQRGASVS
jgi:diguanylate cyclase (GGDEF)-like protein